MKAHSMEDLMRRSDVIGQEMTALVVQKYAIDLEIANRTCPFKVGDTLRANVGLGVQGVIVKEIIPPTFPAGDHRWVVKTNAITKDGRESNRGVSYVYADLAEIGLRHG